MSQQHLLSLDEGVVRCGASYEQIWAEQIAMGGSAGPLEVEAYVLGLLQPDELQHNRLAQAINELFLDLGLDHLVAYYDEQTSDPWPRARHE